MAVKITQSGKRKIQKAIASAEAINLQPKSRQKTFHYNRGFWASITSKGEPSPDVGSSEVSYEDVIGYAWKEIVGNGSQKAGGRQGNLTFNWAICLSGEAEVGDKVWMFTDIVQNKAIFAFLKTDGVDLANPSGLEWIEDSDDNGQRDLRIKLDSDDSGFEKVLDFTSDNALCLKLGLGIKGNDPAEGINLDLEEIAGDGIGVDEDTLIVDATAPLCIINDKLTLPLGNGLEYESPGTPYLKVKISDAFGFDMNGKLVPTGYTGQITVVTSVDFNTETTQTATLTFNSGLLESIT